MLAKDRSDARGAFGLGNVSKLFWRDAREGNAGPLQPAHHLSGDGGGKEFLAVKQGVYREAAIDCRNEVAYSFDEEQSLVVAIAAITLKSLDLRYDGSDVQLPKIGGCFIAHSPLAEPDGPGYLRPFSFVLDRQFALNKDFG